MRTRRPHHLAAVGATLLAACSQGQPARPGSSGGTLSGIQLAAPLVAVASPVAARSATPVSSNARLSRAYASADGKDATTTAPSLPAQIAALTDRLGKTTVADCLAGIRLDMPRARTECYGPSIAFAGSPDWPSDFTAERAGPGSIDACPGLWDFTGKKSGCSGGGDDLGMWLATEPSSGEACTSATMNAQVLAASGLVNSAVTLMAGLICVAHVDGKTLAVGAAPLEYASVLSANLGGMSFTTAAVGQLANQSDGRPTYRITIGGSRTETDPGGATHASALAVTAVHSPGDATAGQIHGYVDHYDGYTAQVVRTAFSVGYEIAGGKVRYELRTGQTSGAVTEEQLFDADGSFDFTRQIARRDGYGLGGGTFERAEIDKASGLGTIKHAWQAGDGDMWTRVFHAATAAGAAGAPDTGVGYFGYGPALDQPTLGGMSGMWCNWHFPGAWDKSVPAPNSPNVQAQTMVRDVTTGQFVPVENHILYAPTNSCDVASSQGFRYEPYWGTPPTLDEVEALDAMAVPNQLVPYGDLGAIPEVAAPAPYDMTPGS